LKLYVCYGTFPVPLRPGGHPCGNAHAALEAAGHHPEVIRSYGLGPLPGLFNRTRGRREVKELTGSYQVPVLVTDEGEVVTESAEIVRWAETHPAGAPPMPGATP
jgi:glutathione S-transferase-like protein